MSSVGAKPYFCHVCSERIAVVDESEPFCPICLQGFAEEYIDPNPNPNPNPSSVSTMTLLSRSTPSPFSHSSYPLLRPPPSTFRTLISSPPLLLYPIPLDLEDFLITNPSSVGARDKGRGKNVKQLTWVLLLKAHRAAGCLTSIAPALLTLVFAV